MPPQMVEYIEGLKAWADANKKDARRDSIKFWSLKGPAIVVASSSGLLATLHLSTTISILFGLIGGICVALDGIIRPGIMHKTHIRAVHDLLFLANNIRSQWNISYLSGKHSGPNAAEILETAEKKKQEIACYLKAEESDMLHDDDKRSRK